GSDPRIRIDYSSVAAGFVQALLLSCGWSESSVDKSGATGDKLYGRLARDSLHSRSIYNPSDNPELVD
ncbi:MAG: hypothetical protein V2I33_16260, partial [Kangiellaceae bacterium]|nr:hypothetical protein [Kangiellaceae bacterium]